MRISIKKKKFIKTSTRGHDGFKYEGNFNKESQRWYIENKREIIINRNSQEKKKKLKLRNVQRTKVNPDFRVLIALLKSNI